jgi:hypothetical protein
VYNLNYTPTILGVNIEDKLRLGYANRKSWIAVVWEGNICQYFLLHQISSVSLVRERTLPTDRPPLVGDVGANFYG